MENIEKELNAIEGYKVIDEKIRWTLRATVERTMYLPDERYLQLVQVKWLSLPPNRPINPTTIFRKTGIHSNFLPHLERSQNYNCAVLIDFFTDNMGENPTIVGLTVMRNLDV